VTPVEAEPAVGAILVARDFDSVMNPWILAARPKTLPAAFVPVWVGSMPLLVDGNPSTGSGFLFACTLASCLCIQVATNLFNDAIDHEKGADTGDRLGPRRMTASGALEPGTVLIGALVFCVLAAVVALPLIAERGWIIVAIGLVSLFFSYGYTGGPFPLAYRGMGELFVILFFGFVAVLGSYFVQSGTLGGMPIWLLGLQCGLYSSVLIAVNNLRDLEEDRLSGKRTVAVRLGKTFARWEIALFCFVPVMIWIIGPTVLSVTETIVLLAVFLPIAGHIKRKIFHTEPSRVYNLYLALGSVQLLLFGGFATWVFAT